MITEITIINRNNEKISGLLKEKTSSNILIICCHGYKGSRNHPAIASITEQLYNMGHSMFVFNFSHSAKGANLIQQVSDIKDIIHFFKRYKKIIILAGSFGSLSGTIATIQSPQIKGLITVNGFFGFRKLGYAYLKEYILFRILTLYVKKYRDIFYFAKNNYQPEKITIKTFVIHARNDTEVFMAQSNEFFKKLSGKKELYILENADHNLTKEAYRQETANVIDTWLRNEYQTNAS